MKSGNETHTEVCPHCNRRMIPHTVDAGKFHTKFCSFCGHVISDVVKEEALTR